MNVLSTRVALRERSTAEVFDLAFRFVVARGGRIYLKLWLWACLPMLLGCAALRFKQVEWFWVWVLAGAGLVVAQIPFTLAASRLLLGDELSLRALVKAWLPQVLVQLAMHAMALVALGVSAFLVFPVPFLLARFLYLPEISLLEGSGLMQSYERGTRVTQQRMGSAFEAGSFLAALLGAFVLAAEVTGRAIQIDLLSLPAPADALLEGGSYYALFGFFAAVPFVATARFLTYIDTRTRREAWDVQIRFTELATSPKGAR